MAVRNLLLSYVVILSGVARLCLFALLSDARATQSKNLSSVLSATNAMA